MESILVIDDDPANALLCKKLLEMQGYHVIAASKALDALNFFHTEDFDLMLTDIRMPDMDGFALIEEVRRLDPEIGILIMTGYGTMDNAIQALHSGADGLILKPIEKLEDLIESVTSVLEKRKNRIDSLRLRILRPLFDISGRLFEISSPIKLREQIYRDLWDTSRAVCIEIFERDKDSEKWVCKFCNGSQSDRKLEDTCFQKFLDSIFEARDQVASEVEDEAASEFGRILCESAETQVLVIRINRERKQFIFVLIRPEHDWWTEADNEMFTVYANQAAIAIENAELHADADSYIQQLEDSQSSLVQAEKLAALGRLMATLAHELNNPLQGVSNCLYLASRPDVAESQKHEYLKLAEAEIERISRLAQITKDHYKADNYLFRNQDLKEVINSVLELVKPQLRQSEIELILAFPENSVDMNCSEDALRQVILNIILNSIEELHALNISKKLWIDLIEDGENVKIFIEDNGTGLDEQDVNRIFEPFQSTKKDGSGMGLAISYNLIVNLHKGGLSVVPSLYADGLRILIELPRT